MNSFNRSSSTPLKNKTITTIVWHFSHKKGRLISFLRKCFKMSMTNLSILQSNHCSSVQHKCLGIRNGGIDILIQNFGGDLVNRVYRISSQAGE